LVEATGGGVCYRHYGSESLADAIKKMLHNPTEAKALGLKARAAVRESFSIERMATEMAALFNTLTPNPTEA
jgi:glycosyltransferase involved in cell wall biosynthesis